MKTKRQLPPIEIRDARLRGGRLKISSRTSSMPEWRRRYAAVAGLLDAGEYVLLEQLRARKIHIADLQRAWEAGDLSPLRPSGRTYRLGPECEALLQRVTEGTLGTYQALVNALLAQFGADRDMATVSTEEATAFLLAPRVKRDGKIQPWSPGRRQLMGIAAGRLWSDCIRAAAEAADIGGGGERPAITRNPWTEAKKSRAVKDKIRPRVGYLRPAQWQSLLGAVEGTARAAFYGLGCLAGLRLEEVLQLRTELDVDFAHNRIRVQPREGEYDWKPKSERGVRDVPITPSLRAILEAHVAAGYAGERYFIRHAGMDRPVTQSAVTHWVKADFGAAGLPRGRAGDGLTYHSLRHTFASWAVQEGESILKVAKIMGDKPDMIAEVYGHLAPTDLETVTDAVERRMRAGIHRNSH